MASPKLLLGGLVGVGSVSTAAVVAHQQGFFPSFSNQTQSSSNAADAGTPNNPGSPQPATAGTESNPITTKPNQAKVEKWLEENQGTENWEIKIQKGDDAKGFKEAEIEEDDLDGLFDYLDSGTNKELLRSIFSALETKDLIFDKTSGGWKHILTNTNIKEWVKTKSNKNTVTLKLFEGEEEKTLTTITDKGELQKLFECLKENEGKFTDLKEDKTLIFEKTNSGWKHIQKSIEDWIKEKTGGLNALKTKNNSTDQELSKWSDEDLKKLFEYIKGYEKLFTTWRNEGDANKPSLEFKKDGGIWKLIASQKTIEMWVEAISGGNATLKLWEGNEEKTLSTISGTEDLEKILECLEKDEEEEKNKQLFEELAGKTDKKTLVFEKVDNNEWKHIKKAINGWMETNAAGKFTIQIKNSEKDGMTIEAAEDEDLTGLLGHLKSAGSGYASEASTDTLKTIKLQKKTDGGTNGWGKAT